MNTSCILLHLAAHLSAEVARKSFEAEENLWCCELFNYHEELRARYSIFKSTSLHNASTGTSKLFLKNENFIAKSFTIVELAIFASTFRLSSGVYETPECFVSDWLKSFLMFKVSCSGNEHELKHLNVIDSKSLHSMCLLYTLFTQISLNFQIIQ